MNLDFSAFFRLLCALALVFLTGAWLGATGRMFAFSSPPHVAVAADAGAM
jgi:hypothetical protein